MPVFFNSLKLSRVIHISEALQYYTGVMILTALFMAAALVVFVFSRTIDRRARMMFMIVAIDVICVVLTDWFSVLIDGTMPELRTVHAISTAVTFTLAPAIPVVLAGAIYPIEKVPWALAIVSIHAVLEFASIFGGFIFWVDEANLYHRGFLYPIYILTYAFSCVHLIVMSMLSGREYQSTNIVAVSAVIVCLVVGIVIQLLVPAAHTSWTALAMSVMLYYVYYSDITLRNDALTKLLSRRSYEEMLADPPLPCTVVLLDIDDFKDVNDTYGHTFGDECLITISSQIKQTFGNYGQCFRTGGDEFVAIMTMKLDQVETLASSFDDAMKKERSVELRLPGVSIGYALADEKCTDINAVIDAADATMYGAKRTGKSMREIPGQTANDAAYAGTADADENASVEVRMESDARA